MVLIVGAFLTDIIIDVDSGLGPKEHLHEIGIDVVQDMPAVGSHLVRHPPRFASPLADLQHRKTISESLSSSPFLLKTHSTTFTQAL